jgi:hypothetical protein
MRVDVESISVVGVRLAAHMDITSGDGHVRISSIRLSIERFSLCHGFHPFFALNGRILYLFFFCVKSVFSQLQGDTNSVSSAELCLAHHDFVLSSLKIIMQALKTQYPQNGIGGWYRARAKHPARRLQPPAL